MKIAGIIAEYNPFHNGHLYQIEKTKKDLGVDYIVAVMSGNFVMRGEAALYNKFLHLNLMPRNMKNNERQIMYNDNMRRR